MSDILVPWKEKRWPFYSIVALLLGGAVLIYLGLPEESPIRSVGTGGVFWGGMSIFAGCMGGVFGAMLGYWKGEEVRCVLVTETEDCVFRHFEYRYKFLWPIRSRMMILNRSTGDPFWADTGALVRDDDTPAALRDFRVHHDNLSRIQEGFKLLTKPETGE